MSKAESLLPVSRTWRDIPQQVKPRAMSREGKRRLTLQLARVAGGLIALGVAGVAAWQVTRVMDGKNGAFATKPVPIGDNVVMTTDGVLDGAWVRRALALPANATLGSIDPAALRLRLLVGGQVAAADLTRHFPRTLVVHLAERMPVARLMGETTGGARREYLVARDGIVYEGAGYDPQMVRTLPWLDGVKPIPGGPGIARVNGMPAAAEFLANAKILAEGIYRTWEVVSLSRLESDRLIETRTAQGTKYIFALDAAFLPQLAYLDKVLQRVPVAIVKQVDLSLGTQVPVQLQPTAFSSPK